MPSATAPNAPPDVNMPSGLIYTNDASPGIARLKRGKGFAYRRANGRAITDARELQRIRSLAIPPAYREVWICPRPDGHLQATGLDARGRKQYRYHTAWRAGRDVEKFDRLEDFANRLPRIRRHVARGLAEQQHGRTPLLAAVVRLLDTTLGRIGNDQYARENGSYGLTTLCNRHVRLRGNRLELAFRGKSGVKHCLHVDDPHVVRVVRRCLDLPGTGLFRYTDEAGTPHCIGSAEANEYLKSIAGDDFTAKDFRTWHASVLGFETTARALARAEKGFTIKRMLGVVSEALGNTPAVCRKSYVHPQVVAFATLAGRDADAARALLSECGPVPMKAGLRQSERRLLAFLAHADSLAPLPQVPGATPKK